MLNACGNGAISFLMQIYRRIQVHLRKQLSECLVSRSSRVFKVHTGIYAWFKTRSTAFTHKIMIPGKETYFPEFYLQLTLA